MGDMMEMKQVATLKNAPSMVSGVLGQNVLNHVVEDRRKELVRIQHLNMEELIVKKDMMKIKKVATLKNAPSMVSGVLGQNVLNHVVEERRKELAQIQHLNMEELIVKKDMMEMKKVATLKNAQSMVSGVLGQNVLNHVAEERRKELVRIQHLNMEELIVKWDMMEMKQVATLKNAPSMVSGVLGQNVLNHVVEERRKELAQIRHLNMEELIVKKDMMEMKK